MALKRFCGKVGCQNVTTERYCEEHQGQAKANDRIRGTASQRGYNYKWRQYSIRFLKHNPLCACDECKKLPVPLPAEVVDHIVPHRGNQALFWDPNNHQPMAKRCHDRKTVREDGGFGR